MSHCSAVPRGKGSRVVMGRGIMIDGARVGRIGLELYSIRARIGGSIDQGQRTVDLTVMVARELGNHRAFMEAPIVFPWDARASAARGDRSGRGYHAFIRHGAFQDCAVRSGTELRLDINPVRKV